MLDFIFIWDVGEFLAKRVVESREVCIWKCRIVVAQAACMSWLGIFKVGYKFNFNFLFVHNPCVIHFFFQLEDFIYSSFIYGCCMKYGCVTISQCKPVGSWFHHPNVFCFLRVIWGKIVIFALVLRVVRHFRSLRSFEFHGVWLLFFWFHGKCFQKFPRSIF